MKAYHKEFLSTNSAEVKKIPTSIDAFFYKMIGRVKARKSIINRYSKIADHVVLSIKKSSTYSDHVRKRH